MIKKLLFCSLVFFNVVTFAYHAYANEGSLTPPPVTSHEEPMHPTHLLSVGSNDEKLYSNAQLSVSNVYPNPADDVISFDYTIHDLQLHAKITVRNVLGVVVGEYDLSAHGSRIEIDASQLSAGVYFYTLAVNNKNVATKKFLVR